MTVNLRKIKNDKLVKYYFSLEAARWEDAAKSPNARKLYEYYCYKRQFDLYNKTNPWVVVSNVGLWEMRIKMHRETKANIIRKLVEAGKDRFPTEGKDSRTTDGGKVKYGAVPLGPALSDATLSVLSSKNNANIEIRFSDVFPTSVSGLLFSQQASDVDYLSATITFQYKLYEFATKGASKATTTVS